MKSLLGLLLLAMFLPADPSKISNAETSESFRVVAIHKRDNGYSNFTSVAFMSQAEFDSFIKRTATQTGWNNRQEFADALGDAKVDFTREVLVLLRHDESSGSVQVTFEKPTVKDRKLVCQIRGRPIPPGFGGTADMAYYCFAVVVSKSAVREVELQAVEGGFHERRLAPIVFPIAATEQRYGSAGEVEGRILMKYVATKQEVLNRGVPSDDFLDQLVAWGKQAPDEIFATNTFDDVYSSVKNSLGPWRDLKHRRAVMLEVMRVLAGFESSWDWNEGVDTHNPNSITAKTMEAGAWQVSADSVNFGQELKDLVRREVGTLDGVAFQQAMKANHSLAMEYVARLLRRTTSHHGPVLRHEIDPWLRRDAVDEFESLLSSS